MATLIVKTSLQLQPHDVLIVDAAIKGMVASNSTEQYSNQNGVYGYFTKVLTTWLNHEFGPNLGGLIYNDYSHDCEDGQDFMNWLEQYLNERANVINVE